MISDWRNILALVITVVWTASYLISVGMGDYTSIAIITPVMTFAASYMLARNGGWRKNGK